MTTLEACIENGLIRKDVPDLQKAKNSLKTAEHNLDLAQRNLEAGIYESALISAYTCMFHTARSLLYKDGYKERGHYALYIFLLEKYSNKIEAKYINELNTLRSIRHKVIYGNEELAIREVEETEAHSSIKIAEGFLKSVKKIFGLE
ncbi:HEPN domain-containing protein [Candidatus Micrarchaeota archaeon]|nr:HEPN domain-containing protein [Candidatus Micrarchaeota archaeon]